MRIENAPLIGHIDFDNWMDKFVKRIIISDHIEGLERSSDPPEPAEGAFVIWMSDGTGKGDDGDIMIASQAGGTTNYGTLFDHSAGSAW